MTMFYTGSEAKYVSELAAKNRLANMPPVKEPARYKPAAMIADDYESIRTRMEEIAAERLKEPEPAGTVTLTGQNITLTNANIHIPALTLDWSIYAPVNV